MKIKLDEKEIAQIVKEWAMLTYKTKNVSVMYQLDMDQAHIAVRLDKDYKYGDMCHVSDANKHITLTPAKLNSISVDVEVTLRDEDYGSATSVLANEAINRVRGQSNVETGIEADLSPRPSDAGVPLS